MYDILIIGQENRDELQFFPLKYILEKKYGLKVYISFNFMNYKSLIIKYKPKIIMSHQAAAPFLVDMYKIGRKFNCINIAFRSEGLIYDDVDIDIFGVKEAYGNLVDFEILWGQLAKKLLKNSYSLQYEKRIVLGAPKYSFFTKDKKNFFMTRNEINIYFAFQYKRKNIVIATGYGIAERDLSELNTMPEYGFKNNENLEKLEELKKLKSQRIIERDKMIKFIRRLIKLNKYNVILKIHPNELRYTKNNLKVYNELKYLENESFKILFPNNYDISVNDLFDWADLWFHRGSTTAVEAWMNDIITIEMNFEYDESIIKSKISRGSIIVNNEKEIFKILSNDIYQIDKTKKRIQQDLIIDYFNGINNKADEKISNFLYRNIKSFRIFNISIYNKISLYIMAHLSFIKLEILSLLKKRKSNKQYNKEFNYKYKNFLKKMERLDD